MGTDFIYSVPVILCDLFRYFGIGNFFGNFFGNFAGGFVLGGFVLFGLILGVVILGNGSLGVCFKRLPIGDHIVLEVKGLDLF